MSVCSFAVHQCMSISLPADPSPTRTHYSHIRGVSDSMCNDTVRTRIEREGMRAQPRGGLGMGNVESFKWRGGWKAEKKKNAWMEAMTRRGQRWDVG